MTQGATGRAAVVPRLEFSCHQADQRHINESPVKALLPGRGDLLPLSRVGRWLLAYAFLALASSSKNKPLGQAQAVGLTTADFPQITVGGCDHDR
jgi:hypothetical protein